jgi:hypothetical protein
VVLFGGPIASPWMKLFENRLGFTVELRYDHVGHIIKNAPESGGQGTYTANDSVGYCVVAYPPDPGNQGKVLLIQGTDAEAAAAGGSILLSEVQLMDLQNRLHVTKLPYLEVLFRTSQVPETALTATIVAYRFIPPYIDELLWSIRDIDPEVERPSSIPLSGLPFPEWRQQYVHP